MMQDRDVSEQKMPENTSMPAVGTTQQEAPDFMTIEGMRGEEYSYGIFIFMLIGVIAFVGVIINFLRRARREGSMKRGEQLMFVWIMVGTVVAVIIGALQLLEGQLL